MSFNLLFEKILVPYDGSKFADKALEYAIAPAKLSRSDKKTTQIILLHVVPEIPIPLTFERPVRSPKTGRTIALTQYIEELGEEMIANASKMLEEKKQKYLSDDVPVAVETKLLVGHPSQKIIEFVNKEKVDLIVIGNVGLSGLSKVKALGSVSRSVSIIQNL
jgi:nucleotide-binding universal stress UspA family protein